MADSSTTAIDRVFDLVDSFADKADRVLNRKKYTEDQHQARRARGAKISKRSEVIDVDTAPTVKVVKPEAPASSSAIATRRFRIIEVVAAESGQTIFVVTNGAAARAECSTRALAEKILRALETAP